MSNLYEAWKKLVPDCRVKNRRHRVPGPLGLMERVYCLNCGAPMGACTTDDGMGITNDPDHIVNICDRCYWLYGSIGIPEIPPAMINPTIQDCFSGGIII